MINNEKIETKTNRPSHSELMKPGMEDHLTCLISRPPLSAFVTCSMKG